MTKNNNYKNTILTSMIALTLLTSVIAVGGIQNAYAGAFGELNCSVLPETVDRTLAAGEWTDLSKVIECSLDVPFFVDIQSFDVANSPTECLLPQGIDVNLSVPIIDQDSLSAQYTETIQVFGDTIPGEYHCEIEFAAALFGDIFFCEFGDNGPTVLNGFPLDQEGIEECEDVGGEVLQEFFEASNSLPLEQTIWVEVPELERTPDDICNVQTDGQYPNGIGEVGLDTVLVKCFNAEDPCFAEGVPVKDGDPTECSFAVIGANSFGETFIINDAIPAEWSLIGFEEISSCDEGPANKGKKDDKSATLVECVAEPGEFSGFYATVETRESPGKGHKEGTVYKPTSCGNFNLNNGAVMLLGDENGDPILEEIEDGVFEPIVLAETGPLELEAIAEVCEPELG